MRILLVDWLGRGGIAQTSDEWIRTLVASGHEVSLATRPSRQLAFADHGATVLEFPNLPSTTAVVEHLALVAVACRHIVRVRPDVVIVQNYVLPELEIPVLLAARRYRARSVVVAHEPQTPHAPRQHRRLLATELQRADLVVCYSRFVAGALLAAVGKVPVEIIPLPVISAVVNKVGEVASVVPVGSDPLALHFGHLHRSYKGTSVVTELARSGVRGWRLALVGTGAPMRLDGATCVSRFLTDAEVANTVAAAEVVILPYTHAAQSAAVALAQALGCVVVATSVGGIPEQVPHGTGLLLDPQAPPSRWREALLELDERARVDIVRKARALVAVNQEGFVAGVEVAVSSD